MLVLVDVSPIDKRTGGSDDEILAGVPVGSDSLGRFVIPPIGRNKSQVGHVVLQSMLVARGWIPIPSRDTRELEPVAWELEPVADVQHSRC